MSSSASTPVAKPAAPSGNTLLRILNQLSMPLLALVTALVLGGIVIWITSGKFETVIQAYYGLVRGAFIKERGFSETLVATTPYILLGLAVAVGFKSGLFNIGVEGQFYIGAVSAAWAGQAFIGLPAIIYLPLTIFAAALGGAIWGAIPGYLKAKTGAHEVINTIMMNYVAFRFAEYVVSGPLKDKAASVVQTPRISPEAELWTMAAVPQRLQNPLNALAVALLMAFLALIVARWLVKRPALSKRITGAGQRRAVLVGFSGLIGVITFVGLPALTRVWWPFTDKYDRLHVGLLLALLAAVGVWWFLWHTTRGFELRMVGANSSAARYAGINITRSIVLAMSISGALAGIAGAIEVLGVSICRCLPLFFSSGYGFDSIAIALLAKNNPFGIIAGALLFGAMRNGADFMELNSGVSKYIISVIQAVVLLFVAAPAMVRLIYRIKARRSEEESSAIRLGSGG